MNKKAVYGIIIAVLLPAFGYLLMKQVGGDATAMPRHYIYDSVYSSVVDGKQVIDTQWHRFPDFSLTNQLNRPVSLKDMQNKIIVANFFFTHCPTICPRLTANIKKVHDGIKSTERGSNLDQDYVQFLSFSIDPERDSVPALKQWADRFQINPANWWLLTGNKKTIYDLSIEDMKLGLIDGKNIDTNFMHTDYVVLIDKKRNIRGYYHGLDTSMLSQLSKDLVFLELEKDPKKKSDLVSQLGLVIPVFIIAIIGIGILIVVLRKENKAIA